MIVSKKSNQLNEKEILNICKLKETYWKHGINSQKKFFKKNYKKKDIHNLFVFKKKLIGYNSLKFRKNKNFQYLIFDSLIIHKKFQNKKLSSKLMNFNKKLIKKFKITCFLSCDKYLFYFYKKYGWKKIKKKSCEVKDLKKNYIAMYFNDNNINKKKKLISINLKN